MTTLPPGLRRFLSPRHGSNAWALRKDVIDAWKRGAQLDVRPMTAEYSPIVTCNADCYACPFRRSRLRIGDKTLLPGAVALEDDEHASTRDTAMRVVEAAYSGGVRGFLWTGGGEPTIWAPLLDMLEYSGKLGITNALYTNGFVLGSDAAYAPQLLAPSRQMAFVRISINSVTPRVTQLHWGVDPDEVAHQLTGLARLLDARNAIASEYEAGRLPSVQVSTVVDKQNVDDLEGICETVARIFREHRTVAGPEDRLIVRPMTYHGRPVYSAHDHPDWVIQKTIAACGSGSLGRSLLAAAGVPLFLGFGLDAIERGTAASYPALIEDTYARRTVSLATGLFLIVGPSGSVHASTEHNCDVAWSFGNLRSQTIEEIYVSRQRREMLEYLNANHWGPSVAQATSRTERLDRIALAVRDGVLVDGDIDLIRAIALDGHSLILD